MWSGSDVAPPDRDAAGCDVNNKNIAENSIAGPLVDTVTTAVAEMDVGDRGEPKMPFSLRCSIESARGAESHPVRAHIAAFTSAARVLRWRLPRPTRCRCRRAWAASASCSLYRARAAGQHQVLRPDRCGGLIGRRFCDIGADVRARPRRYEGRPCPPSSAVR